MVCLYEFKVVVLYVVFDCCAHAHKGSCTQARSREKHFLSHSADPDMLAEGVFFFFNSVCVVLIIFSCKLKQEEWISSLNE
jgi:hypothetical protein